MLKIGLTGGIGSGKTTVANTFHSHGFPVYIADTEASRLINSSRGIREALTALFGPDIYRADLTLDKTKLASIIFNDAEALQQVNRIVHPQVMEDFENWSRQQQAPAVFFESAILFEAGLEAHFDSVICVTANLSIRIKRVMKRDGIPEKRVLERIKNQANETGKCRKSDFVIDTTDGETWKKQVSFIEQKLTEK